MAAVNIAGLRRNIKNVAHNYTDAQVKVREATSNDPWGPSSTQMSEIADLTYNVMAFSEIMQMIWKRLNDHGKNWRHVYKSLVLLEYLIKTGSEKVAQQCKENIYAIQTLKDFQYLDDNKDQGINVREKAKSLVALLKDEERLRNERVRALKAKERFAQSAPGIGNDTVYRERFDNFDPNYRRSPNEVELSADLEAARPQTLGEEELQLQLALAMSREEAEQEESKNKSDDIRLQLAIQKSKEATSGETKSGAPEKKPSNDLLELADINFGNPLVQTTPPPAPTRTAASSSSIDPWGIQTPQQDLTSSDPWSSGSVKEAHVLGNDPWSPVQAQATSSSGQARSQGGADPWNPLAASPDGADRNSAFTSPSCNNGGSPNDPWVSVQMKPQPDPHSIDPFSPQAQQHLQEFDLLREVIDQPSASSSNGVRGAGANFTPISTTSPNPFDLGDMKSNLSETGTKPKRGVQSLMEEHSNLVNLDNLLSYNKAPARNPFEQQVVNPFQSGKTTKPAMNQLLNVGSGGPGNWQAPQPPQTSNNNGSTDFNPFF